MVQAQREEMLKQLLKVNVPKQTVPKSMIEQWLALSREGALDDERLFGEIAKRVWDAGVYAGGGGAD